MWLGQQGCAVSDRTPEISLVCWMDELLAIHGINQDASLYGLSVVVNLFYSPNDDDYTSWIADYQENDWWFVLDLSTEMSFDAVKIANSVCKPYNDGYTKGFRQGQYT